MGRGPVPFTAIDRMAARLGIVEPAEFEAFLRLMRACDDEFLAFHARDSADVKYMPAGDMSAADFDAMFG